MLFGGEEGKHKQPVTNPPPPVADAGVVMPAIDAPEAETVDVHVETDPPGAQIQQDGIDKGTAPLDVKRVVHDHYYELVASLPGYDDAKATVNPFVDKSKKIVIRLKKTPKGTAPIKIN